MTDAPVRGQDVGAQHGQAIGDRRGPEGSAVHPSAAVAVARGPDHPPLGEATTFIVDRGLGGAISAGARAKEPPSLEPNEDGFLLRRDAGRVALLVLDGAGGFSAAGAVLDSVDAALPDLLRHEILTVAATEVWAAALRARDRVRSQVHALRPRPHVAASLALVEADGTTWCATTGDTAVMAVDVGTVRVLSGVAPHLDHQAALPQPQRLRLAIDTVLVGVSDGFFDALGPRWPFAVRDAVQLVGREGAAAVAEHLVSVALQAGAPDHVTVVVHQRGIDAAGRNARQS